MGELLNKYIKSFFQWNFDKSTQLLTSHIQFILILNESIAFRASKKNI